MPKVLNLWITCQCKSQVHTTGNYVVNGHINLAVGGGLPSFKFPPHGPPKHSSGSLGETPLELSIHNGQRILSLDGGGLKGLILIEVLIYIERLTGKKIVELFDWIVGSSTGGVIALALVYGKSFIVEFPKFGQTSKRPDN